MAFMKESVSTLRAFFIFLALLLGVKVAVLLVQQPINIIIVFEIIDIEYE